MVCARVMVLPDPVTPSSVWYLSPRLRPAVSSAMALGWSPAGEKGAMTSKRGLLIGGNIHCRALFGNDTGDSPQRHRGHRGHRSVILCALCASVVNGPRQAAIAAQNCSKTAM